MTTLSRSPHFMALPPARHDSIASASESFELHGRWQEIHNGLSEQLATSPIGADDPDAGVPTRAAVESARQWVVRLQLKWPASPPSSFLPTPDGGLILEKRSGDNLFVYEFGPDGTAGHDWFMGDQLVHSLTLPPVPEHDPFVRYVTITQTRQQ